MTTKTTIDTITDDQIARLRTEAGEHGDLEMVAVCTKALRGDRKAIKECVDVIAEAEARS